MGATDAINALRSEAVAKTGQINVLSENVANCNTDSQKTAATVREMRSHAKNNLVEENTQVDTQRMAIRQSTRSAGEAVIGLIFNMINAAFSSSTSAVNIAIDSATVALDVATIVQDMFKRNRHWENAKLAANYTAMYSPGVLPAR